MKREGTVSWPPDAVRHYVDAGYWRGRPLGDYIWEWARLYGDRIALVDGETRLSYRELAARADSLAEGLYTEGLRDGDNIIVQLPNSWEFAVLLLACQRLGVAPVLALLAHREHELRQLAELSGARAMVVPDRWQDFEHQELAAKLAAGSAVPLSVFVVGETVDRGHRDVRALLFCDGDVHRRRDWLDRMAPDSRDVALFLLSGGTTGTPKIIARTHDDYEFNARRSAEVCEFGEDTVFLVALPLAHNFPLGSPGLLGTLMNGGCAVMTSSPKPEAAFPVIERERVTTSPLVPAIAQRWVDAVAVSEHDVSSLDTVQIGGSVLPEGFAVRLGETMECRVQQVYGMAEGLLNYTRIDDPPHVIANTQGRPICEADEYRIVDEDGRPAGPGRPGELLTRGPYTLRGYFRASEHNLRAFTSDGWYRTGDVVSLDISGNFVVHARVKDLVNRGGEKISAPEVEELALDLPQVHQAAVIPAPDPEIGERVCLCVVLYPEWTLTLEEVRASFAERGVAKYKIPELVAVVSELPLTPIGKIDKKLLRNQVLGSTEIVAAGT